MLLIMSSSGPFLTIRAVRALKQMTMASTDMQTRTPTITVWPRVCDLTTSGVTSGGRDCELIVIAVQDRVAVAATVSCGVIGDADGLTVGGGGFETRATGHRDMLRVAAID
jgi:hypothetical protein